MSFNAVDREEAAKQFTKRLVWIVLRLDHRGVRHRRFDGGEDAAQKAILTAQAAAFCPIN